MQPHSALLRGNLLDGGGADITFYYWLDGSGVTGTVAVLDVVEDEFTGTVTGLVMNTNYSYRCRASNAYGQAWSGVESFATPYGLLG